MPSTDGISFTMWSTILAELFFHIVAFLAQEPYDRDNQKNISNLKACRRWRELCNSQNLWLFFWHRDISSNLPTDLSKPIYWHYRTAIYSLRRVLINDDITCMSSKWNIACRDFPQYYYFTSPARRYCHLVDWNCLYALENLMKGRDFPFEDVLYYCLEQKKYTLVDMILAEPNAKRSLYGWQPLMLAVALGKEELFACLLTELPFSVESIEHVMTHTHCEKMKKVLTTYLNSLAG